MIEISLLGKPQVTVNGQPVKGFPTAKTVALLAYLALERNGPHAREHLMLLLWPENDDTSARQNLSQTLSRLRRALGPGADCIVATRKTIGLAPTVVVHVDVNNFFQLVESAERHSHTDRATCATCQEKLAQAVALVRGELLAGVHVGNSDEFDHWLLLNRQRVHDLHLDALADLTDGALTQQAHRAAIDYARRQITLERWRERASAQLIRALSLSGQRSAALTEYDRLRGVLAAEFGVEPSEATRALVEQVRSHALPKSDGPRPVSNLPASLTPFIGRNETVQAIVAQLTQDKTRLITICGQGGIGKTRLALEVGRQLAVQAATLFTSISFVPLAGIDSASNIPAAIASALNLTLPRQTDTAQAVIDQLRTRHLLLILDNFEQFVGDNRWLLALLRAAPGVRLLVTSRERLRLLAEDVFELHGLAVPSADTPLADAPTFAGVLLFANLAQRIDKRFQLDAASWPHVIAICRLLDGLPLGIELAVMLSQSYTLAEIVTFIDEDAQALASDWHDVGDHQRSLQLVFEQSWQRLTPAEQTALARLSVMRGEFARADAVRVAAVPPVIVTQLRHKSLLRAAGSNRLDIHPLIRQFAATKLAQQPNVASNAHQAHAELYLTRLGHYYRARSDEQPAQLKTISQTFDNVDAAWQWAVSAEKTALLAASVNGLARFHIDSRLYNDGRNPFQSLIDRYAARSPVQMTTAERDLLAHAYIQAAGLFLDMVRDVDGEVFLAEAERLLAKESDPGVKALYAFHRGRIQLLQAQSDKALATLESGLENARRSDNRLIEGALLREIGSVHRQRGDYATFLYYIKEALTLARTMDEKFRQQALLYFLGMYTAMAGSYWPGRVHLLAAETFDSITQSAYHRAAITSSLGTVDTLLGDYAAGLRRHRQGQKILQPINEPWRMTLLLIEMASTQMALDAPDDAAATLAEARALAEKHGMVEHQARVALAEAHRLLAAQQWADAHQMATAAAVQMAAIKRQIGVVEAEILRAYCALRSGAALDSAALDSALAFVADRRLDGAYKRELLYWQAYSVAQTTGSPLATAVLRSGQAFVDGVSAEITDLATQRLYRQQPTVTQLLEAEPT